MDITQLSFTVLASTLLILTICAVVVVLLVMNNTRRIRHRAELAELQQQQDRAVMDAEREAMQHALHELGRELHDNVGQLLAVAQMGLNTALEEGPDHEVLQAASNALEHGMEEVRRLGHDLNSDLWKNRTLLDAISAEAERVERVARVQVHLLAEGPPPVLPVDTSIVLFRVFQVILANALKHSGADRIDIRLDTSDGLDLRITDNGVGFDPAKTEAHAGMLNIHKRCALIGFTAQCHAAPGNGCTWQIKPHTPHGT